MKINAPFMGILTFFVICLFIYLVVYWFKKIGNCTVSDIISIIALLFNFVMILLMLFTIKEGQKSNIELIAANRKFTQLQLDKSDDQIALIRNQISEGNKQTKLLENQVFVANSIAIAEIGDRCMWSHPNGGDYGSYLLLKTMEQDPINEKIRKSITAQIERVERAYKAENVLKIRASLEKGIMISPDKWATADTITIPLIFTYMGRHLIPEQIRAAYFMGECVTTEKLIKFGKSWGDVLEALVKAIEDDTWCMFGKKMALMSYEKFADKKFEVLDFEAAVNDWRDRKTEILEKLNSDVKKSNEEKNPSDRLNNRSSFFEKGDPLREK